MRDKLIYKLTKSALPLLMVFAFLLPSISALLSTSSTHQLTLEVCTDHGVQLVQLSDSPTKDQTSSKSADHCPLCQLPVATGLAVQVFAFEWIFSSPHSLPLLEAKSQHSVQAWTHLPARAPPALV
jgi:Protein of unknown function (DUF2946)